MGLPLQTFVELGFSLAKNLVPEAFEPDCIVRLDPTYQDNPVTETRVASWGATVTVELFGFDDEDEREQLPVNVSQRTFLLQVSDYPLGIKFSQDAEVETSDGVTWTIYRAEIAPGGTIVLLYGRS